MSGYPEALLNLYEEALQISAGPDLLVQAQELRKSLGLEAPPPVMPEATVLGFRRGLFGFAYLFEDTYCGSRPPDNCYDIPLWTYSQLVVVFGYDRVRQFNLEALGYPFQFKDEVFRKMLFKHGVFRKMLEVNPAIIMLNNTPSVVVQREALDHYRTALKTFLGITP